MYSSEVCQDYDKAIGLCQSVIAAAPRCPDAYALMVLVHTDRGDEEQAIKYRLIESTCVPEADVEWTTLAQYFRRIGELKQAQYFYRRALKQSPDDTVD